MPKTTKIKIIVLASISILIILVIGAFIFVMAKKKDTLKEANNFEDCVKYSDSTISEIYPRKCNMKDGRSFTEKLTGEQVDIRKITQKKDIKFETLDKSDGVTSGKVKKDQIVMRNKEDLNKLWAEVSEDTESKFQVDFDKEYVVGVFLGKQGSGGYSIEITDVIENNEFISINYTETSPAKDCATTSVITSPYHIIKIPKTEKQIAFNGYPRAGSCN